MVVLVRLTALTFLALTALPPRTSAQATVAPRATRVLLFDELQVQGQANLLFAKRLRETVGKELGSPIELYQESLDLDRFRSSEHSSTLADYFNKKYSGVAIDVVVPIGSRALKFAIDRLSEVLPNVPIVCGLCSTPPVDPAALPANVTGRIASALRYGPTLSMARVLQPNADRVVVVGGAGALDSAGISAAIMAAKAGSDPLPLTVFRGFALDSLLRALRLLSPRSIVLLAPYLRDPTGQTFDAQDIVASLAHASSAPMYALPRAFVGEGVVGGSVANADDEGVRTGRLVVRVLRRRPGEPMPASEPVAFSFAVDWRQLQRWGLSEARLPPGTDVLFREPSWWARYGGIALLALVVIAVESMLISRLLLEQSRRKHAQLELEGQHRLAEETRRQVVHMGRLALVGELAATIGHELRQPLTALHTNAQAGARFLRSNARDFDLKDRQVFSDIFADMVADSERASDIMTRIRALLRKEDLPSNAVDLNEVCRAAERLLQHDAVNRHVEIILSLEPRVPTVAGDPVQFQQVVLNLALNAIDACASSTHPQVRLTTVVRDEEVEVAVIDNGPGLGTDVQQHLFESFFTTKTDGLGLGLVIVRSIVERYHGRVCAGNAEHGGAIFRVIIPLSPRVRGGRRAGVRNEALLGSKADSFPRR